MDFDHPPVWPSPNCRSFGKSPWWRNGPCIHSFSGKSIARLSMALSNPTLLHHDICDHMSIIEYCTLVVWCSMSMLCISTFFDYKNWLYHLFPYWNAYWLDWKPPFSWGKKMKPWFHYAWHVKFRRMISHWLSPIWPKTKRVNTKPGFRDLYKCPVNIQMNDTTPDFLEMPLLRGRDFCLTQNMAGHTKSALFRGCNTCRNWDNSHLKPIKLLVLNIAMLMILAGRVMKQHLWYVRYPNKDQSCWNIVRHSLFQVPSSNLLQSRE